MGGPSNDPEIEALRERQMMNMLATLMLSRGVPTLLDGEEFRCSQDRNNNAYCQDNVISWYDGSLRSQHQEIYDFISGMVSFRHRQMFLCTEEFYTSDDVIWFDAAGKIPDWSAPQWQLGCYLHPLDFAPDELGILCNAEDNVLEFKFPGRSANGWPQVVNTARSGKLDDAVLESSTVYLSPFPVVVLERISWK
jgi:glycogen operon protein